MNLNGIEYCYIRNVQGDVTGLFDKDGMQVVSYTYDTWGKLISIKDQNGIDVTDDTTHVGYKNPYRYRGYRYDSETGLYYLQSRYYNPEWGRYINADNNIGKKGELLSHNIFAYAYNNPVNMVDLNGNLSIWNGITNYGKKAIEKAKEVIDVTISTVKNFVNAAWTSMEIEAGIGTGLGVGGGIKSGKKRVLGAEAGGYVERLTVRLDNGKFQSGSSIQAAAGITLPGIASGSAEYKAFNTFKGSMYGDPLQAIGEDPNSQIDRNVSIKFLKESVSVDFNNLRFGVELKAAAGIQARIDIQFNITEFIRVFP